MSTAQHMTALDMTEQDKRLDRIDQARPRQNGPREDTGCGRDVGRGLVREALM